MQFVLTAKCTEAKSKELVIWAPTVVMRHLQCNDPNQIFGCASSDAISHIVTVALAEGGKLALEEKRPREVGAGREGEGKGTRSVSLIPAHTSRPLFISVIPLKRLHRLDRGQICIKPTKNVEMHTSWGLDFPLSSKDIPDASGTLLFYYPLLRCMSHHGDTVTGFEKYLLVNMAILISVI